MQRLRASLQAAFLPAILAVFAAAPARVLAADEPAFSITGSIRVRQEILDGQYRPGYDGRDNMAAIRSSLQARWHFGDWRLLAELSDSRAYETAEGSYLTANEVNTMEPVQLSLQRRFHEPFGAGSEATLELGRMEINLGSRRLVASDSFRNTPQGSTGLRADLIFASRLQWSLLYVLPQQRRPDDFDSLLDNEVQLDHEGWDQQMWGTLLSKPDLFPGVLGEFIYVGFDERDHGSRQTRDRNLQSFGVRALRSPAPGHADFEAEAIWQTGSTSAGSSPTALRADVDAWFLRAVAGYSFTAPGKPRVAIELNHASGDGPGGKYQRFDTLFGMRSGDYAPSGIYAMLGRTNVQSIVLRGEASWTRLDAYATWSWLWAADRHDTFATSGIGDPAGNSGIYAGQQFDMRARYWIFPRTLRAELNLTWFMRDDLLLNAPNASPHGNPLFGAFALVWTF